jgi:hypothetical protein
MPGQTPGQRFTFPLGKKPRGDGGLHHVRGLFRSICRTYHRGSGVKPRVRVNIVLRWSRLLFSVDARMWQRCRLESATT